MKWTTTTVLFWVIRNRSKFVNIIIIVVVAVFGWLDRVCWSSSHAVPWLEVHRLLRFPVWWPKTDLKTKKKAESYPSRRGLSRFLSACTYGVERWSRFRAVKSNNNCFLAASVLELKLLRCAECHETALSAFLVGEGQARAESSKTMWLW